MSDRLEEAFRDIEQGYYKTNIDLGKAWIGYEGAKRVAEALKHNNSVIKIDLTLNNIGARGSRRNF